MAELHQYRTLVQNTCRFQFSLFENHLLHKLFQSSFIDKIKITKIKGK